MLPSRPPAAPPSDARPAPRRAARLAVAGLAALLPAACGYPDSALTPPPRPFSPAVASTVEAPAPDMPGLGTPFVVIRFGPEPVDVAAALAEPVGEALARRPAVRFHLLAIASTVAAGGGSRPEGAPPLGHGEAVLRGLAELGVPPDRVDLSAALAPAGTVDEVRLYLR